MTPPPITSDRTVLILSPYFPPSSLAGVHRARHLAKGLPQHGWRPVIIRAAPQDYTETGDPALARLVPETVEQLQARAWPAALTRRVGIGDIGVRGYGGFGRALTQAAQQTGTRVVMLTGAPFYPFLLARRLRALGLKVVLDFQDPWVKTGGPAPKGIKAQAARRLASWLEPRALAHADAVTSVSDEQNRQMAARTPWLDVPMAAIPIGGDPDDFAALRRDPPGDLIHPLAKDMINLCYVGTFMPRSGPLMEVILRAAHRLTQRRPDLRDRVVLNFVGTSNQPDATGPGPALALAQQVGVADLVRETPRRVPYLQALTLLAQADGLLLVGSDERHYTASKIYPNLMAGRPYLSLFHGASSAHAILSQAQGGRCVSFDDPAGLPDCLPQVEAALEELIDHPSRFAPAAPDSYAAYTAQGVAAQYAALFERLVEGAG